MYSVVIVDDEKWFREGIKKKLIKYNLGLEIIGEASNAEQGQEIVLRLKPDILLCDIRIGEVDGSMMAQVIRDQLPQTQIIIVSGHNEFEYAKKAIQIGVTEYIVKPIADDEFYQVLQSTVGLIREEKFNHHVVAKSQLEMEINALIDMKKMQFPYERFLRSHVLGESHLISLCVLLYDDQNYIFPGSASDDENDSLTHRLYGLFYDQDGQDVFCFKRNTYEYYFLFSFPASIDPDLRDSTIDDYAKRICVSLHNGFGIDVSIGASTAQTDVRLAILESHNAMKHRIFTHQRLIRYDDILSSFHTFKLTPELEEMIKYEIKNHSLESLKCMLETIFQDIHRNPPSFKGFQTLLVSLVRIAEEVLKQQIETEPHTVVVIEDSLEWIEHVYLCTSLDHIRTSMIELFEFVMKLLVNKPDKFKREHISSAINYIQHNYHNRITLEIVAKIMHINPCYLSILFKEVTGTNFLEYISTIRIDKAKELLMDSRMSIQSISLSVGYSNQRYFSQTFKKLIGYTPSEYRAYFHEGGNQTGRAAN